VRAYGSSDAGGRGEEARSWEHPAKEKAHEGKEEEREESPSPRTSLKEKEKGKGPVLYRQNGRGSQLLKGPLCWPWWPPPQRKGGGKARIQ